MIEAKLSKKITNASNSITLHIDATNIHYCCPKPPIFY
jgi:hypothetical protein